MKHRTPSTPHFLCILLLAACARGGDAPPEPRAESSAALRGAPEHAASVTSSSPLGDSAQRVVPAAVIDSARPMSALVERFQQGLPAPAQLANAVSSREGLVRGLMQALERRDTSTVAQLFVTRAEFAWLYFPASTLARPPYEIDPAFAWFQLSSESERGIHKALRLLGGTGAQYVGSSCDPRPEAQGVVRVWSTCTVRWRSPDGAETEAALFASIIEHEGRFKFFSYSNRL